MDPLQEAMLIMATLEKHIPGTHHVKRIGIDISQDDTIHLSFSIVAVKTADSGTNPSTQEADNKKGNAQ